jgi:hypothetical protein
MMKSVRFAAREILRAAWTSFLSARVQVTAETVMLSAERFEWTAGDRAKYYSFRRYMSHINGCTGGGDQACACGMASVRFNLEQLLDTCEECFEFDAVAKQK